MGFRINTNIAAMNSHQYGVSNNRSLNTSLERLSSGLRINTAADDSSGLAIANSLKSQASGLGQAVANANDAIGVMQIADGAMDEQLKILNTIKTKSIQAASDTQSTSSRAAIQKDVNRLIEQLDNIAKTTSFNGQSLLSGQYTNKNFQVGAYANQTITASISDTQSVSIGNVTRKENVVEIGNSVAAGATSNKGSDLLQLSAASVLDGLAVGDKITIDGQDGTFTVTDFTTAAGVQATADTAVAVKLDRALAQDVSTTDKVSIEEHAALDGGLTLDADILAVAIGTAIDFKVGGVLPGVAEILKGVAVGDVITLSDSFSGVSQDLTVTDVDNNGDMKFAETTVASAALTTSISFKSRADAGTAANSADFVQYTVDGTELSGVQLTDSDGYGVANTGLGKVADLVNATSDVTGISALATVEMKSDAKVQAGSLSSDMKINGTTILVSGTSLTAGDTDSKLVNAINEQKGATGVTASISNGKLELSSDGRAMHLSGFSGATGLADGIEAGSIEFSKNGVSEITVSSSHFSDASLGTANGGATTHGQVSSFDKLSDLVYGTNGTDTTIGLLNTQEGAMMAIKIADAAIEALGEVRSDLGSVQNQLTATVNNISVTAVNVTAAESQIRDVDFAAESANFSKHNILSQSGSYAMSQANAIQQNVLRLLQ